MIADSSFYDTPKSEQGFVYILKLENNKLYVGHNCEIEDRIASHFLGNGNLWTKKHKPLELVSVKQGDTLMENLTTIALMSKYGYEDVRGGNWCKVEMLNPPAPLAKALKYAKPKEDEKAS
jgi:predicted GIY-YIG superfamily endonuclease